MLGTRPTFSRRGKKQHKCCERYARDLLLLDFEEVLPPGEGGVTPFDPRPSILAVLVEGKKARGILGAIPAEPRIENRECYPRFSLGRNKDRLAHQLKVANRAGCVAETLSRGLRHRRRGSEASP